MFVHVPKTAGTALQKSIGLDFQIDHLTAKQYQALLRSHFKRLFKFAFVRDPWDRFLSNYYYARMKESYLHSAVGPSTYGKHLDYDLLKDASILECAEYLIEGKLKHHKTAERPSHWDPQHLWLYDDRQRCLVDWIGRVENFENDFIFLCDRLGIESRLLKINASERPKHEHWTDDTLAAHEIIVNFYNKDYLLLGYDPAPTSSRQYQRSGNQQTYGA